LDYAFFPISSIVSVLSPMKDGASPEVAIIGNDGLVGVALLMGAWPSPTPGPWCKAPAMAFVYGH